MSALLLILTNSIFWVLLHFLSGYLSHLLPSSFYTLKNPWFKKRCWELDGRLYVKLFRVKAWKDRVPEAGELFRINPFNKKRFISKQKAYVERFILETCRGELAHWLPILFYPLSIIWNPPIGCWIMLAYALLANLPFVIIQRYNRIRLVRLGKEISS